MSDLNLPPEQLLPEDRKTRMRHELMAAVDEETRQRRTPAWLGPSVAAAAVLGIVAAGVAFISDEPGGTPSQAAGAPSGATEDQETEPTASPPTEPQEPLVTYYRDGDFLVIEPLAPGETATSERVPAEEDEPSDSPTESESCDAEVADFARSRPALEGAAITAERDYGPATTFLYETKTAWVVCDMWAQWDGGPPSLWNFHDKSDDYAPDEQTLAISMNFLAGSGPGTAQYAAGGRDFDGVEAIAYEFPDGHVEKAVVGRNGLWSMAYLPDQALRTDEPVHVTVDYTEALGGGRQSFTLQWGTHTCAQLNHGC